MPEEAGPIWAILYFGTLLDLICINLFSQSLVLLHMFIIRDLRRDI